MEDKLLGRAIPGSIAETGGGDVLEKGVGINDGLGRLRGVVPEFTVITLGVEGTLVFSNNSLPFIRLEDMDEDSIHVVLLLLKKHFVFVGGWDVAGIKNIT